MLRLNQTTFTATHNGAIARIGGQGAAFMPQLQVERDGRFIRIEHGDRPGPALGFSGDIITQRVGGRTHRYREILGDLPEQDRLRYEIVYDSRADMPAQEVFTLSATPGTQFLYQGVLSADQIIRGATPRDDEVIGSYAVKMPGVFGYYKTSHIYAMYLVDSLGARIKVPFKIPTDATSLIVDYTNDPNLYAGDPQYVYPANDSRSGESRVPAFSDIQAWLDGATFPVTLDPDFGYTTVGASWFSIEALAYGSEAAPASSGTLDSMSAYVRETFANNTHTYRLGIYDNNTTGAALIDQTTTQATATTAGGWVTVAGMTGASVTGSTTYRLLCGAGGGGGALELAYDDNVSASTPTYGTFDPTTGYANPRNLGDTTEDYSVYATYTASGGSINLTIQDATHSHLADSPALTQLHVLAIQDALHAHTAESPTLTQLHVLTINDATHSHTADSPTLTQQHVLAIQDALHAHTAESPTPNTSTQLVIADALHGHVADSLTLTQQHVLAIQDALHAHTADAVALTQNHILIISDALHSHIADNVSITLPSGAITPDDRVFVITSENRTYIIAREDRTHVISHENRTYTIH